TFCARGSGEHRIPLALENHFEGAQGAACIIHDQNSGHARRSSLGYMTGASPMCPEACLSRAGFPDVSLPKAKHRYSLGYNLMTDTYHHSNILAATRGRGSSQNDIAYHFERTDITYDRSIESASIYEHSASSGPLSASQRVAIVPTRTGALMVLKNKCPQHR